MRIRSVIVVAALAAASGPALAQEAPDMGHAERLAIVAVSAPAKLTVTSPAFKDGGDIPFENTQYRGNHFPGVSWSKGPAATKSYVVVMQGELGKAYSIHFNLFNVPAEVTKLDTGLKAPPAGATYGATLHGINQGYVGPHTHNFSKQPYYLQVFALNTTAPADPNMTLVALEKLMAGHVVASGQIMGRATMDPDSQEAKDYVKSGKGKPPAAD